MGYFFTNLQDDSRSEAALVRALASPSGDTARAAAAGLWERWMNEAGPLARVELDRGIDAMHAGELDDAASVFLDLCEEHPAWAEAINKLATVRYLQGMIDESIRLCGDVVKLKPDHFGAWNGMALCAMQVDDWLLAREAALQSMRLQPASVASRQVLALIDSRLANC